jgi:hypothetical protein
VGCSISSSLVVDLLRFREASAGIGKVSSRWVSAKGARGIEK